MTVSGPPRNQRGFSFSAEILGRLRGRRSRYPQTAPTPPNGWPGAVELDAESCAPAIGYITLKDVLTGCQQEIQAERDRNLDAAKEQRRRLSRCASNRSGFADEIFRVFAEQHPEIRIIASNATPGVTQMIQHARASRDTSIVGELSEAMVR
jgi:hypothetical protein